MKPPHARISHPCLARRQALAWLSLALGSGASLSARAETLPQRNLWLDIRWVDGSVSNAALGGAREGAVVLGTAGSVSPHGAVVLSTRRDDGGLGNQQIQRLLVLNGSTAQVRLSEPMPVQWVDFGVQMEAGGARGSRPATASASTVWVAPRSGLQERSAEFNVLPQWPGGRQPVRVQVSTLIQGGGADSGPSQARSQVQSTVLVPLGEWLTVARSGVQAKRSEPGVLSTRDAQAQQTRELQLRVDLAP